jgi:hypothetical protein
MPESTLTLCQSRLYPPVRNFGFGLRPVEEDRYIFLPFESGARGPDTDRNIFSCRRVLWPRVQYWWTYFSAVRARCQISLTRSAARRPSDQPNTDGRIFLPFWARCQISLTRSAARRPSDRLRSAQHWWTYFSAFRAHCQISLTRSAARRPSDLPNTDGRIFLPLGPTARSP